MATKKTASVLDRLKKRSAQKNKPYETTLEIEEGFEVTLIINSVSLGDLLTYVDSYPSMHHLITGVKDIEELDEVEKMKKGIEYLEMINVIVALGVQIKDEDGTLHSLDIEEGDLVPSELFTSNQLMELGQMVMKNFRAR